MAPCFSSLRQTAGLAELETHCQALQGPAAAQNQTEGAEKAGEGVGKGAQALQGHCDSPACLFGGGWGVKAAGSLLLVSITHGDTINLLL